MSEKRKYVIEVSQNGWEYTGYVEFEAIKVEALSDKIIIVDGIKVSFDEQVVVGEGIDL